jgi:hypothetical protein
MVVLTADHGFPNVPEFSQSIKRDAQRLDGKQMSAALSKHLAEKFGQENLVRKWSPPNVILDYTLIEQRI